MVEEAVEDGRGDGGVTVEDGGPLLEGLIGGEDDGTAFVAGTNDLEQKIGSALVDGQVADFVEDENGRSGVFAQFGFEGSLGLGGVKSVDDIDGVGEEHAQARLAGGITQRGGEMGFAQSDEAEDEDVGLIVDELETEEILDLEAIDFFGPVPAERVESFDDGELGGFDATGGGPVASRGGFPLDELGKVIEVGEGVFCGGGGKGLAVLLQERQAQSGEPGVEVVEVGFHRLS